MQHKIEAVRNYLAAEFPRAGLKRPPADDRKLELDYKAVMFRIEVGPALYVLCVSEEFLDDNSPSSVDDRLRQWEVARELRRAGRKPLLVTKQGMQLIGP